MWYVPLYVWYPWWFSVHMCALFQLESCHNIILRTRARTYQRWYVCTIPCNTMVPRPRTNGTRVPWYKCTSTFLNNNKPRRYTDTLYHTLYTPDSHTASQPNRQTKRRADRPTDRQTGRQAGRTDRRTDTSTSIRPSRLADR